MVILRDLPDRERKEFLRQYHRAVDAAHDPAGYQPLRRPLHVWSLTTVAARQPGLPGPAFDSLIETMAEVIDYPDDPLRTFPTSDPYIRCVEFGDADLITSGDAARQARTLRPLIRINREISRETRCTLIALRQVREPAAPFGSMSHHRAFGSSLWTGRTG